MSWTHLDLQFSPQSLLGSSAGKQQAYDKELDHLMQELHGWKAHSSPRVQSERQYYPGLIAIAECVHPLLEIIGGFLIDSPQDVGRVFHLTSRSLAQQAGYSTESLWHDIYAYRFKPFSRLLEFLGTRHTLKDWRTLYKDTFEGKIEFIVEVFDRQKKAGFAMSAMPARIHYDRAAQGFVAWYMSASQVPPELIPEYQQHRIRACPTPTLEQLCYSSNLVTEVPFERRWGARCTDRSRWVGKSPDVPEEEQASYPYSVFGTTKGFKVGQPVELQWKMQGRSPFGWWFGLLESLSQEDDTLAIATIIFPHFSPTSQWYRLTVRIGDGEIRDCALGGKSGGLRPVAAEERVQWMKHFPSNPIQDP
jgi:hypothetical protein